jgi:hypothetical protein
MGWEAVLFHWGDHSPTKPLCSTNEVSRTTATQIYPQISPYIVTQSAITFKGEDVWLYRNRRRAITTTSVLHGPFYFTSPTVYIAHHDIVMERKTLGITLQAGTVKTAGVIAVNATDVYTNHMSISNAHKWASSVSRDRLNNSFKYPSTSLRRMNFADLKNPVPATAYYSHHHHCWWAGKACATITDNTFRPALFFHDRIWLSIFSDYYPTGCSWPVVWDPPLEITRLPDGTPMDEPDYQRKRAAGTVVEVLATLTTVVRNDVMPTGAPATIIAAPSAHHATVTERR